MVVLLEAQSGETQDGLEKIRNTRLAVTKLKIHVILIYFDLFWDGMAWLFLSEIQTRTTGIRGRGWWTSGENQQRKEGEAGQV